MRHVFMFAIAIPMALALGTGGGIASACDEAAWSEPSRGLRARLAMRRSHVFNGTGIVAIHVELENVGNRATPMRVPVDEQSLTYRVTDADGREVPISGSVGNGPGFVAAELVLPRDGSLRFRVAPRGSGVAPDQAALVDLGPSFVWFLPRDGKAYYLHAVLEIPKAKDARGERDDRWHGRLELPRVRIPTESEPIDPARLGPLIDDLGAKMLAEDADVSDEAMRELSLIDDPRVIPWYVKAVKTDRYSLKFNALDRLCRLEGDAALEGLKIGMATQGEDLGHCTTASVATQLAVNIRHQAAVALARSPHPQTMALLLSMEEDPAMSVRLTVVQAAALMTTPESLALLERHTRDPDGTVRSEAVRLLEIRKSATAKKPAD